MSDRDWISAKDRLPDRPGRYLAVISGISSGYIKVVAFTNKLSNIYEFEWMGDRGAGKRNKYDRPGWYDCDGEGYWEERVTHWMPLPEMPKE